MGVILVGIAEETNRLVGHESNSYFDHNEVPRLVRSDSKTAV